jgi:hypothetical protein
MAVQRSSRTARLIVSRAAAAAGADQVAAFDWLATARSSRRLVLAQLPFSTVNMGSDVRYEFGARRDALRTVTECPAPRRSHRDPITRDEHLVEVDRLCRQKMFARQEARHNRFAVAHRSARGHHVRVFSDTDRGI